MLHLDKLSLNIPDTTKPRVVVIGGGFGGVNLVKNLPGKEFQVVLFDKQNYHGFWPLLYQVATAGIEAEAMSEPLRKIFDENYEDVHFRNLRVNSVNPLAKTVSTSVGDLPYDYLVIASGTKSNFFGNEQIKKHAFPLKKTSEAIDIRNQLIQCFEQANMIQDPVLRQSLLNFVVVGGGPTGVEMAGALAEMRQHVLPNDYPNLDFSQMKIYLVEGLDRVLPPLAPQSSARAKKYLEELGVILKLNTFVESYDGKVVTFKGGEQIPTETLIWGAGVMGAVIDGMPADSAERGRYIVNDFSQVKGFNDIFAIGDIAFMQQEKYPRGHPGVAQPAIQQGKHLAGNLARLRRNQALVPFKYFDKGSLAIVGRNRAVADLPMGNLHLGGFLAWMAWSYVHVSFLEGFRNKMVVMSNWIHRFFTRERGTRVLVTPFVQEEDLIGQEFYKAQQKD